MSSDEVEFALGGAVEVTAGVEVKGAVPVPNEEGCEYVVLFP